jgi:tRNA/tmRNA/rRNA uracil-C5-methylase (TrmA/RlmC/RlmD family)
VLDVACGNGNATLAAARRFCTTTGVDYVPALVERAQAEGFAALAAAGRQALAADIARLVTDYNREQRGGGVAVPGEYLETVFERRR